MSSLRSSGAGGLSGSVNLGASMSLMADDYYDDADAGGGGGGQLSKEEERERKKALQARIRKEQADGPPPDMAKRALIFDSRSKIISRTFGKGAARAGVTGETRGTYVFTWGAGYHGQLGRQFERGRKKYATIPKMVHLDVAIRQIACGGLHTAAVTDAGTLYTWGDARAHQLGYQPHGFTNQPTPHLVESLDGVAFIVGVACGQSHTVCLTDKGSLISFGLSKHGQCGHGDRQSVKAPRKIRMDDPTVKFTQVSCGDKHTAALTTKGAVWAFGSCQQGQGGFDESPPVDKLKPTEVKSLSDAGVIVSSVVCGSIHTCMVTDEGALYICGFGEHFYPNEDQNFFYRPVQVPFHEKVVQVACGQSHILALTASADVYTLGSGLYGQLGQGVKGDLNVPRLVLTGKNIAQVSAGRYHSVALTSFGTLYTFGCGESGQLGHASDENILFPKVVEANLGTVVGQIACGEHHTAVLTSTPWAKADSQVEDWLRAEQEEYALKLRFIKRSNHGLVRKDLLRISERMAALKAEWAQAKALKEAREEAELAGHVDSVKGRGAILAEMAEEQRQREERAARGETGAAGQWGHHGHTANSASFAMDGEAKESDRPDSASRPLATGGRAGMMSGSQTARPSAANYSKTAGYPGGLTSARRSTTQIGPVDGTTAYSLASATAAAAAAASAGGTDVMGANAARATFLRESANMVRRMKGIIAESGDASTDARLKKTLTGVFSFRKDFDSLVNLTRKKQRVLEQIQRKVASLRRTNDSSSHRRRIHELLLKALKMKLSTVSIKLTETDENRRNYLLNIAHLKEEELERFYQLEHLRKQVNDNEIFTRKVNEMKLQQCEEASKAEQELADFRQEIASFHVFIADQLAKFHAISSIANQRKAKRDAEKSSRSAKTHEKINARIARLQHDLSDKTAEALSMGAQLESVNERLRYFEKRFQSIASATGLTDPAAIINKFGLKEEIRAELQSEIKAKTALLAEMNAELDTLRGELAEAQAGFQESKWKDVDVLYKLVHDAQANAAHHQSECDRLDERLAYYKEGMLALLSMLPEEIAAQPLSDGSDASGVGATLADLEGADLSHERVMSLIQVLGDRLLSLADQVTEGETMRATRAREAEEQRRAAEAAQQARLAQEIAEKLKSSTLRQSAGQTQQSGYGDAHLSEGGYDEQDDEAEDDEGEDGAGAQGYDDAAHDEEDVHQLTAHQQQPLQRTQQRQAIPHYADQQYQIQQY